MNSFIIISEIMLRTVVFNDTTSTWFKNHVNV